MALVSWFWDVEVAARRLDFSGKSGRAAHASVLNLAPFAPAPFSFFVFQAVLRGSDVGSTNRRKEAKEILKTYHGVIYIQS